ncbi:MAG: DNA alkylation repair protein [Polyangia bacterium]
MTRRTSGGLGPGATLSEVLQHLSRLGSEAHRKSVARLGVPSESALGVPTAEIRKLGRALGRDSQLARALWETGIHEARLLAALVLPLADATPDLLLSWLRAVRSWDLCDHICNNLVLQVKKCRPRLRVWTRDTHEFVRRAAFSTIAGVMIHDATIEPDEVVGFFALIHECAGDGSAYVRKAVSWALREIGKSGAFTDRALLLAQELNRSQDEAERWVGKDALSELETLVPVAERTRLLSSKTKMGSKSREKPI